MTIKIKFSSQKKPENSLAETLNKNNNVLAGTLISPAPLNTIQNTNNPILASLNNEQKQIPAITNKAPIDSNIPIVTAEKYALIAETSDTLSQAVITEFNLRMNYIISAMNNPELPDAMKRVLEYTQTHNELQPWLREQDIAVFVRGARQSYARVAEKKTTNRKKRSKSAELDNDIMQSLMDLEIDI